MIHERKTRTYSSPLRESQALKTRDLILDALTELLSEQRADETTTKEIAQRAGVSQPTVYRHFPDRQALIEGLTGRLHGPANGRAGTSMTLDGFAEVIEDLFVRSDDLAVEATAEALFNADPRRFSANTRENTENLLRAVETELPELDERTRVQLAALLRCIGSAQTWLRMREEFGVSGPESGPVAAWAINRLGD